MAGKVVVSTLNNDTGVLATQNGMTGICKAWVNFNGNSASATIRASFNVSSITSSATGQFLINFTTTLADANYALAGSGVTGNNGDYVLLQGSTGVATTKTASQVLIRTNGGSGTAGYGSDQVSVIICGN